MSHVSISGLAATDAEDDASQRHPRGAAAAQEVLEGIMRRDGFEDIWHVPTGTQGIGTCCRALERQPIEKLTCAAYRP